MECVVSIDYTAVISVSNKAFNTQRWQETFHICLYYFQTAVMDQMSMKEKLNVSTIASNELFWIIIVVLVLFMFFLKE